MYQNALSQVYTIEPRPDSNYTQYYSDESTYDAAGRVKTRSLGDQNFNITYEYYAWDASHGQGRLRSQVTTRLTDNAEIQNLRYENQSGSVGYDAVGNLMEMTEWRNGLFQTQSYQYDGLNRLTHASAANPAYSEEYTYDATTGNLSSKGGVSYTYGSSHPHAVTGLNGQQLYAYDANGNMTSRTVNGVTYTLSYDGENHLTALSGGGLSVRYGYDGDGKRVLAVIGSTRTVYIGDYFEAEIGSGISSVSAPTLANHNPTCDEAWCKRNYLTIVSNPTPKNPGAISPLSGNYGSTRYHTHPAAPPAGIQWRTYYYAGTQRIAQRTWSSSGSTLNFLLSDHLGSTRQVIDADGNRVEEVQYKAWGETLAQTGSDATRRKYTGQIESEAGLYFYNARYYDPYITQFTQPDNIIPNPNNSLDWNRYNYVRYNPINNIDPSGHAVQDDVKDGGAWSYFDNWRADRWGPSAGSDIPEPKQLTSSTWSYFTVTGGMAVGPGSDPVDYYSDYEGQVANSGNSEFYVNNWAPQVECASTNGAARAMCYAPVILDTILRVWRPITQTANQNVGWTTTFAVHDKVMDPVKFNIWTTHKNVQLNGIYFENGLNAGSVETELNVLPVFGGDVTLTDLPKGFDIKRPLTVSAQVRCNYCYDTGQGPFSMSTTGSTIVYGKP